MTSFFLAAQAANGGGGGLSMLIMMLAIFAIMWGFMIYPQQKKQKQVRAFQNALSEGTKVVIGGGIYGTVKRIDLANGIVEVEIAKGTVIRVDKTYVFADMQSAAQVQTK